MVGGNVKMLNTKEKLDKLFGLMFDKGKIGKEPPTPTKEDLERKFKIDFGPDGNPKFEEAEEED